MKSVMLVLVCAAIAHGAVVAYHYRHGVYEPVPLQVLWKYCAAIGIYAVVSLVVAMSALLIMTLNDQAQGKPTPRPKPTVETPAP